MVEEGATGRTPVVRQIGADDVECARVRNSFRTFDCRACQCFNQEDKLRIFAVIERCPGGVAEFYHHVQSIASRLFGDARGVSKIGAQLLPEDRLEQGYMSKSWPQSL